MKLEDETDQLVAPLRQIVIAQMLDRLGSDRDRTGVGRIKQTENVEQRALTAARRTNHRVDRSRLQLQRDAAKSVHPRFVFAEIALDSFATQADFGVHTLEPRNVATGGSSAARRAGT